MGFIKEIFSRLAGNAPAEPAAAPEPEELRVTRAPRVHILPLHNIHFVMAGSGSGDPASLANLSFSGVGLLADGHRRWPPPGAMIFGDFLFGGDRHPVSMLVVRSAGKIVGCQFDSSSKERLRPLVLRYFDLELSALRLYPVDPQYLKEEEDGQPHWLRGHDNCELFLVEREGRLVRFNLTFFGNHIEGGAELPLRFGQVVDTEEGGGDGGYKMKESSLISPLASFPPELLERAWRFVANIEPLAEEHRRVILWRLRQGMAGGAGSGEA
ncbi:MAG: hypothetical protein OEV91_00485 [Desulfobulbaceae bacterium]|nr:hypothetical protein [Desulfobulbaceae bacterium]